MMAYDVYSKFDMNRHKETFVNYLEVIVDKTGTVMYAVPSHQRKLEQLAADACKCSVEDIRNMCPPSMYFDYDTWLMNITGAISVWTNVCKWGKDITRKQVSVLKRLKMEGIYKGSIQLQQNSEES